MSGTKKGAESRNNTVGSPAYVRRMNTIPPEWATAITNYIDAQTAAGSPRTTLRTRREHLQHLARRIGSGPWHMTGAELVGYLAQQNWERETRRGRRGTLASFYGWAIRAGWTTDDPLEQVDRVKAADPNPRPVPDRVYLEALVRADADEAIWIDLAAEHGLRRAEISVIHSSDIQETLLGFDLLVHGKGSKLRTVPLTRVMARSLLARPAGYLFPGDDEGHISPRWLGKRVNNLLEGDWTIHKLRHRAATRFWVMAEGDPYAVAELMGWASLNMVRVYVKMPTDRLRRIVEGASRVGAPLASVNSTLTPESRQGRAAI
ncbi:site-specific recombinase XerD [Microterricola gilva]|uniref:Site-specific recombinase XerD n=1 Tax=Microterricola gilva TaxID=393267 RepID=A0A4Q8ARP8_9MICO|nr:tyrosine-type recombinase/integrase [Microterricola gilva]RZU66739.1 site-specific recombinase XerD [Microterricola gilva]